MDAAANDEDDIGILGAGSGGGSGRSSGVGTRNESAESELDELPCCRRRVRDRLRNSFLNEDDVEEDGEEVDLEEDGGECCGGGDMDAVEGSDSRKLNPS